MSFKLLSREIDTLIDNASKLDAFIKNIILAILKFRFLIILLLEKFQTPILIQVFWQAVR